MESQYPLLTKGRILKKEMLMNMRDFPRDVVDINYQEFTDGLVKGLIPTVNKQTIIFSPGITKYKDKIYVFSNPSTITYSETEIEVKIKLNYLGTEDNADFSTSIVEIIIDSDVVKENQQEIGRFKLKTGAYLRSKYQDLLDFSTEYNTINIVNVKYSGYKNTTISHLLLKYFSNELLQTGTQNVFDINFSFMCLNNMRIEKDVILNFILARTNSDIKNIENNEIHKRLVEILNIAKKEARRNTSSDFNRRKIIVD